MTGRAEMGQNVVVLVCSIVVPRVNVVVANEEFVQVHVDSQSHLVSRFK
jgi:hypothetical protein